MEFQANFSNSAFGGFKKEEVIDYLANLERQYAQEQGQQQQQIASLTAQLTELNALVEQQYQKIVETDALCRDCRQALEEKTQELETLRQAYAPYEAAGKAAQELREEAEADAANQKSAAERYALEMRQSADSTRQDAQRQADALLANAQEQANRLIGQAQTEAAQIREGARQEAEQICADARSEAGRITAGANFSANEQAARTRKLLESAQAQADEIRSAARTEADGLLCRAREQVEKSRLLQTESEERIKRLTDSAQKQADDILRAARYEASEEKVRYEEGLKALEQQKEQLLCRLDEARAAIQGISATPKKRTEEEIFKEIRRTTTEALKRKFNQLNGKE